MKYFSLETVEKAYQLISTQTNNKFWGILAITSSVNRVVEPSVVYHLDVNKVSTLLEEQFCLLDSVKEYSKHYTWNVLFSNRWASYIVEKLLPSTPNIYAVLIWYFRREKFPDGISVQDLLKKFLEQTNISADVAKQIFSFQETFSIQFDTEKYLESDLLNKLRTYCNSTLSYTTITAEKSFVVANPGELSRAPFVQTLYASQGIQECMIITQFNFNDLYMIEKDKNNPPHTNSSSLSLQKITYGAPGTGKSHGTNEVVRKFKDTVRTTFHPDSDYSTFVGAYKPTMEKAKNQQIILDYARLLDRLKDYLKNDPTNFTRACTKFGFDYHDSIVHMLDNDYKIPSLVTAATGSSTATYDTNIRAGMNIYESSYSSCNSESKIVYKFIKQAFLKAYILAWKKMCNKGTITTSTVTVRTPITFEFENAKCDQVEIVGEGKDTKVKYRKVDYRPDLKSDVQSKWEELWKTDKFEIPSGQQSGASLKQAICQKIYTELAEKQEPKKSDFEQGWTLLMETLKQGEEVTAEKVDGNQSYILSYDKTKECLIVTTTANSIKSTLEKNFNDKTYRKDKDGKPTSAEGCINDILKGYDESDFNEAWNKFEKDVTGTTTSSTTLTDPLTDIRQFLVIEEINRGNCAQIFGDLFQLLDRKNGYSEYPIEADEDIQKALLDENPDDGLSFGKDGLTLPDEVKNELCKVFEGDANPDAIIEKICMGKVLALPSNLYIWATMNTSDQSLFPIDSAFKRRWDWKYVPIVDAGKGWTIEVGNNQYDWWKFLEAINTQIAGTTSSEDKKMGYFFCKACPEGKISADKFVNKVVFYLWNDVFKDYELPTAFKKEGEGYFCFNDFYTAPEATINQMMKNLKVKAIGEPEETPATESTEEQSAE